MKEGKTYDEIAKKSMCAAYFMTWIIAIDSYIKTLPTTEKLEKSPEKKAEKSPEKKQEKSPEKKQE